MAASLELPALHVEGRDDLHTIIQLLARHGIELDKGRGPVAVKQMEGDTRVLDIMSTAARASTNRSVGFVVDANGAVASRWQAVGERLKEAGIKLPRAPVPDGFIGQSATFKSRVGVWIMPDNAMDTGKLEHLIRTLVPPGDPFFEHACAATTQAVSLGAKFPAQDRIKADLHCWLAWQEEPGLPFGTALKAHYFRDDSEVALLFVAWFKRLFELP